MSIKFRLLLALGALSALLLAAAAGVVTLQHASEAEMTSVYEDRVVPLHDLKAISDAYAVDIVDAAHKVRAGMFTPAMGIEAVGRARAIIRDRWAAYSATYMDAEEQRLARAAEALTLRADRVAGALERALSPHDPVALEAIVVGELYPAVDPVTEAVGRLAGLQLDRAKLAREAAKARSATTYWLLAAAALLGCATIAASGWTVVFGVSRPIAHITARMKALAEGDKASEIPGMERRDELGAMAEALETFRRLALEKDRLEDVAAAERAVRDRRQAAMDRHTQEFGEAVSDVMTSLGVSADVMRQSADRMAAVVRQTHDGADSTANGAEESARNLGAVAAAAEELTASVNEISRQVAQAATAAAEAVGRAEATDVTVRGLSEAAGQIGDVVRLIADIAGQTNLLALNATIEAARAGEAGKGFAVVASEVKQLAAQTARATEQISAQVQAIQGATGDAVGAVREVGEAIGRMNEVATAIAAAVEEQGAATREIAASVQTVARQNDAATRSMREVSEVAKGAGTSSRVVLDTAAEVARVSATLREEVDGFLVSMRTEEGERRRFERIPGGGARAGVRLRGGPDMPAEVRDISRGGMTLLCDLRPDPGTELEITLPGDAGTVAGRVTRATGSMIGLTFRHDPASLARIDRALGFVVAGSRPVAA